MLSCDIVLGFLGRRRNPALMEVFAAQCGWRVRRCQNDDGFRPLFGGKGKSLEKPENGGTDASALVSKACGDETGMQAVGGDSQACQSFGEFPREQDIAQLGTAISLEPSIALFHLQVAEIELGAPVRMRGSVDHARRGRREQAFP